MPATTTGVGALILLVACLCVADARLARDVYSARRSTLAGQNIPAGWYHSIRPKNGNGTWCGLRDFPPRGGYGASRMYCIFPEYDHGWMWRIVKANSSVPTLSSGDEVLLSTFNTMPFKFCQLRTNVMCGYQNGTRFVLEKANGTGVINLTTDDVVFKVGIKYCSLVGKGHNQQLTCAAATKAAATVFNTPASSFVQTRLVNRLSNSSCGGYFYQGDASIPKTISCQNPPIGGFTPNLTVALKQAGAPVVAAGAPITFKAYEDFYSYHVATWVLQGSEINFIPEVTVTDLQWFVLERVTGGSLPAAGSGTLANNTRVALRSASSGLFCGLRAANGTAVTCDNSGPLASLPEGYQYTYIVLT